MSARLTVCLYVRIKLMISVTVGLVGLYSTGNIATSPVVVSGYFLWGGDTPTPQKMPLPHTKMFFICKKKQIGEVGEPPPHHDEKHNEKNMYLLFYGHNHRDCSPLPLPFNS